MLLAAALLVAAPLLQDAIVHPPARRPLPRPVANAPMAAVNQNRVPAGRLVDGTLTLALDVVEAAWQAEGAAEKRARLAEQRKADRLATEVRTLTNFLKKGVAQGNSFRIWSIRAMNTCTT